MFDLSSSSLWFPKLIPSPLEMCAVGGLVRGDRGLYRRPAGFVDGMTEMVKCNRWSVELIVTESSKLHQFITLPYIYSLMIVVDVCAHSIRLLLSSDLIYSYMLYAFPYFAFPTFLTNEDYGWLEPGFCTVVMIRMSQHAWPHHNPLLKHLRSSTLTHTSPFWNEITQQDYFII